MTRALERLGGNLKRKGIAAGAISLGETMAGYGQTQVPAMVVSRVAEEALRAGVASGFAPALSFLMPLAAGVLATSLVAGASRPAAVSMTPPAVATVAPGERQQDQSPESPHDLSLEEMIVGLKRLLSKPNHALTALQTSVLLDSVGISRIPEFIRLANGRLTAGERASIYPKLLEKWLAADPKAAMDFVMLGNVGKQVDTRSGTNLLNNLFEDWERKDRGASESWLFEHWEDPVLRSEAFAGSLRSFLVSQLVEERFANEGVAAVFKLIQRIPNIEDQAVALGGIAGLNRWRESWRRGNPQKWLEFHQALKAFPDAGLRRELSRSFWTTVSQERSDEVREIQRTAEPLDRFQISLGWLGVKSLPGEMTPTLSGGGYTQRSTPVTDQAQRETAALADGLAAGLPEDQVLGEIGRVFIDVRSSGECFKWLDERQGQIDVDDALAAKARKLANANAWSPGEEMIAVDWARRISNDQLRIQLCRGAFRKSLSRSPDAASAYATNDGLPHDLAAELRSILDETP